MPTRLSKPSILWSMSAVLGLWLTGGNTVLAATSLAELPEPGGYTSWIRIVIMVVMMLPWLLFCQWVDKDTVYVRRINREMWNGIVLIGGTVGFLLWMFLPWQTAGLFVAGFGVWLLMTAGTCAVYVIVRNGIVDASARVFTVKHIKTWMSSLGKQKNAKAHAIEERVRLSGHDGKNVPVPDDPTKAGPFEAAQNLLYDALWRRASDVDMIVASNQVKLVYRIDGVATSRNDLFDRQNAERALIFIKSIAGLDIADRRRPQKGSIKGSITGSDRGKTTIEVQTSGTTQYERMTLRIVGEETRIRLSDLGLGASLEESLTAQIAQPGGGLFLISGPPASGVTTTLYAALRKHDAFMQNLLTIERVPLMELENITQHIFDPDKQEGNYARQLQTILRREPDVVMTSDCQDGETAHLAAKAAKEGKRIYIGIDQKDCFAALERLRKLADATDLVADVLRVVTCQRLIRKLCVACRIAYKPDITLLQKLNLPVDKIQQFYRIPRPEERVDQKGNPIICPNCQNSGYYGRTGLFEMLVIDDPIRELIRKGAPTTAMRELARKNGMLYLKEVGLQKVIEGITGMQEMLRVLSDKEENPGIAGRKGG